MAKKDVSKDQYNTNDTSFIDAIRASEQRDFAWRWLQGLMNNEMVGDDSWNSSLMYDVDAVRSSNEPEKYRAIKYLETFMPIGSFVETSSKMGAMDADEIRDKLERDGVVKKYAEGGIVRPPDNDWFLRDGPLIPQQVQDPAAMEKGPGYKAVEDAAIHAKDQLGTFWDWLKNMGAPEDTPQKEFTPAPGDTPAPPPTGLTDDFLTGLEAAQNAAELTPAQNPTDTTTESTGLAGLLAPYMEQAGQIVPKSDHANPYMDELYDLYKAEKDQLKKDMTTRLLFGMAAAPTTNPWKAIGYGGTIAMDAKTQGMDRYRQALGVMAKRTDDMSVRDDDRKLKEVDVALQLLAADQKKNRLGSDFLKQAYLKKIEGIMKNEVFSDEQREAQIRAVDEAIAAGHLSVLFDEPVSGVYNVSD